MTVSATHVRPPAVAGLFYPDNETSLRTMIKSYLEDAASQVTQFDTPKAVIVPHAGYVYSGAAAARGLRRFAPDADTISRIVLLGPCHRADIRGIAAPEARVFTTPLGQIPIDHDAINTVSSLPQVLTDDRPHAEEHSLEVQLPILQSVLGQFTLVPFAVGTATAEEVATVLDALWGGPETRIVISSDLSHFLPQEQAVELDTQTANSIERFDGQALSYDQACGRIPIAGLLASAAQRNLSVERLALLTSADTVGSPDRVVGYGTWTFS